MTKFIVYCIVFTDRLKHGIFPNSYVGSKSNCYLKDNKIYNIKNKEYWGSAKDKEYKKLIKSGEKRTVVILFETDNYRDMIDKEKEIHIKLDVVGDPKYFNKSIANTISNYSNPNFATYKHISSGKIARLERDNPRVISGEWVGVTKNIPAKETTKQKLKNWHKENENPFKGKTHTEITKAKISKKANNRYSNNPKLREAIGKRSKLLFTGVPKSDEHKKKLSESNKDMITIKNKHTNECIRIKRKDAEKFDKEIWLNPFKLAMLRKKQNEDNKN